MKRFLYTFSLLLASVALNAQTVTQVVVDSDIHETLETAVIAAELDDDLAGPGPFTLFAPTDEAFNNLPAGVLDALLLDPTGTLADVLLHHVVSGNVTSDMIMPGPVETLFGQDVLVTVNGDDIMVNGAMVTVADIPADNGVVHVIDAVLLPPAPTVVDIIVESPVHETLETAVGAANLVGALQGEGPFTVFAPTDEAFDNLPAGALDALLADPEGALADVLLYHVYGDLAYSTAIADGLELESLNGDDFMFSIVDGSVFINDAEIIITDIIAENGVVHVIDAVILPPTTVVDVIVGSDVHETLETAVGAAGLVETLSGDGPFTVFAPTDEAFDNLPAGVLDALLADPEGALADVLTHHVVSGNVLAGDLMTGPVETLFGSDVFVTVGDMVMVNNATVIIEDIVTDNGVVHVIDAVINMPAATVVDIIVNSDVHETLELAVTEANLVGALQGEGPFTVFAPTDEAFNNLPAGALDALLADPEGALADVLLYHVFGGAAYSSDIADGLELESLNGDSFMFSIVDGDVFINDAQIVITDLIAENGVVHVIDAVILPPTTVVDIIVNSDVHETLETAVGAAGLVETLQGDGPFTVFAPTDEAFDNLPAGVLDALLADPEGALTDVLLHHVVGGNVLAGDLSTGPVTTLFGDAWVTVDGDMIMINNATVIIEDLVADNGVVHVIDAVIDMPAETVVDIIVNSDVHETLEFAVGEANLVEALQGEGPFTVFAPTDEAFDNLPAGVLDDLLADPEGALANVLLYHVYGDLAYSTDITDGLVLEMLNGDEATLTIDGGVFINDAEIIITDLIAENGVVHVIDAVIVPPAPNTVVDVIVNSDVHETLETAVIAADLVETLSGDGPFTVFAPTDEAFGNLPAGVLDDLLADPEGALTDILLHHVVDGEVLSGDLSAGPVETLYGEDVLVTINGGDIFINGAQVIIADIPADNGVVHVIDAVLITPAETVVDIIVNSDVHEVLETAVVAAGLVDDLQGDGPFTVFAPTDAAFANLPAGALDDLLADPEGALANVLLYHVYGDLAYSTDVSDGLVLDMLNGEEATIFVDEDEIFINNSEIIITDLIAENGVVHVIDAVLLPPVSVSEVAFADLTLYPNPAYDYINVTADAPAGTEYQIMDQTGRVITTGNFNGLITIDVRELPTGIYNLMMISDDTSAVKQFMVK